MATEAITLELNTETDWDGASLTTLSRDNAIVTAQRSWVSVAAVAPEDRLAGRYVRNTL